MIEFGGKIYYIDFEAIDKLIAGDKSLKPQMMTDVEETLIYNDKDTLTGKQVTKTKYHKSKEIDGSKYDILRAMLEVILKGEEEIGADDALGIDRLLAKATLSFKLAFNTLLKYGILKEEIEE